MADERTRERTIPRTTPIVERTGDPRSPLPPDTSQWLAARLLSDATAPLVPVSDLDRALQRVGSSFVDMARDDIDADSLLGRARKLLFPAARVKALHRWLRTTERAEETPAEDAAAAGLVLVLLREIDPLGRAAARHPVLRVVLRVSLEAVRGLDNLRGVVRRVEESGWPADDVERLAPSLRVLRWIPVRVPPVDLVGPLRDLRRKERRTSREAAKQKPQERQLVLIDTASRPLMGSAWLSRDAREALADRLDHWLRKSGRSGKAERLARALRDRLRGGPGDDAAVEALLRASARELLSGRSAAELARVEALLTRARRDPGPALAYGDYLARALRPDEALRAYRVARSVAPATQRHRIDGRIRARRDRIEHGTGAGGPTRSHPAQLFFRF